MPHGANKPVVSPIASAADCTFLISADESTHLRLPFVKRYNEAGSTHAGSFTVTVAFPLSYEKEKRKKYPLVILSSGQGLTGSAIETTRGLAATKEVAECIIVNHDDASLVVEDAPLQAARLEEIITWCRSEFRVEHGEIALLLTKHNAPSINALMEKSPSVVNRMMIADAAVESAGWLAVMSTLQNGRHRIVWSVRKFASAPASDGIAYNHLDEATAEGCTIPALAHGVRTFWSTGHAYGGEMMSLSRPINSAIFSRLVPFIRFARNKFSQVRVDVQAPGRYVFRSKIMDRNFEIFVSRPVTPPRSDKGYPAVFALDANTTWSCVMETAARMASSGEIEDVIAIGIGVPRAEGDISFGLRRFEELSPPVSESAFKNSLGRFFISIFAMFGRNARDHFGRAPQFHQFLSLELLPALMKVLSMDPSRLYLLGHSAAGTYVAYEAVQTDTPFKAFGAFSPGVAISDSWMLKRDGGLANSGNKLDMLVTIGGDEKSNAFNTLAGIPLSQRYALEMKNNTLHNVEYLCMEGETHTSVFSRALALFLNRMFSLQSVEKTHV